MRDCHFLYESGTGGRNSGKNDKKRCKDIAPKNLLFRSDQDVLYVPDELRQVLKWHGIIRSMGGKGEYRNSVPRESFLGKPKQERFAQCWPFKSIEQVQLALFEYIGGYYCAKGSIRFLVMGLRAMPKKNYPRMFDFLPKQM